MALILLLALASANKISIPLSSKEISLKIEPLNPLKDAINMPSLTIKELRTLEYTIKIGIGYPPQMLNLGMNLNNDFTLVPLDTCNCHSSENRYSPQRSVDFESYFNKVSFTSFNYNFKGYWAKDDFLIGNRYLTKTDFIAIQNDDIPDWVNADGFFGLGFPSDESHMTIFEKLKNFHRIEEKRFSVYINNPKRIKKDSTLTIGYWDSEQYGQGVTTTRVLVYTNGTGWQTSVSNMLINEESVNDNQYLSTFDLTHQSIKIPNSTFYEKFITKLPAVANCNLYHSSGKEYYLICNCEGTFPSIQFTINDQKHTITAESYINYNEHGYCSVLIQPNTKQNSYVFGLPFFREYYGMFDMDEKSIYFQKTINLEYHYKQSSVQIYHSGIAFIVVIAMTLGVFYMSKAEVQNAYLRI